MILEFTTSIASPEPTPVYVRSEAIVSVGPVGAAHQVPEWAGCSILFVQAGVMQQLIVCEGAEVVVSAWRKAEGEVLN